jgi:hypothetical protein
MDVERKALGDGQPPAYIFSSPCCGARTVLAAWIVDYAIASSRGQLLIQCGRYGSDPLRAVARYGCGQRYLLGLGAVAPGHEHG